MRLVEGEYANRKITTREDLPAHAKEETAMRVGHGYDVHRLIEGRKLILGGVEIPYEKGLLGHSDADVLAHAVADALLGAVIPLFELDAYATPVIMMAPVPGDSLDPAVEAKYRKALNYDGDIEQMERYAFYERAKKAYAVVITGETAKYGNIILKKGVTPLS